MGGESAEEEGKRKEKKERKEKKRREKEGFSFEDSKRRTRELSCGMTVRQTTCLEMDNC
jgi:hypothetical protein